MHPSIIIPYNLVPARVAVHEWVIRWYQETYPDWDIVPSLYEELPWRKGRAINQGVAKSTGEMLIIVDCDTICEPPQLHTGLTMGEWVIPWTRCLDISKDATEALLDSPGDSVPFAELPTCRVRQDFKYAGGVWIVSREIFDLAGGADERFEGWGGEDEAFCRLLNTIYQPFSQAEGDIYHLFHESANTIAFKQSGNYALWKRYRWATGRPSRMETVITEARKVPAPRPPRPAKERPARTPRPAPKKAAPPAHLQPPRWICGCGYVARTEDALLLHKEACS